MTTEPNCIFTVFFKKSIVDFVFYILKQLHQDL